MKLGVIAGVALMIGACDAPVPQPEAAPPAPVARLEPAPSAPDRTRPYSEKPLLGKAGSDVCAIPTNEMMLAVDNLACMSLLYSSIRIEDAARPDVKVLKTRAAFFQPGPQKDGRTIGWITYDMRVDCAARQGWVLGGVIYDPEGAEITRESFPGGGQLFPSGGTASQLMAGVCEE